MKLYFMIGLPTETDEDVAGSWRPAADEDHRRASTTIAARWG